MKMVPFLYLDDIPLLFRTIQIITVFNKNLVNSFPCLEAVMQIRKDRDTKKRRWKILMDITCEMRSF
jgi:hypothetical protein